MASANYDLKAEIKELQKKHDALILAHYYEDGAIQDIADHVGDSLALAQWGQKASNPVVLMAGVVFMGESVKLLSPEKRVLVPDLKAGCSLVDHSPYKKYLDWRLQHRDAICLTYVNSSAEVKAITDVCVTSSNAEKIVAAIPKDRKILFGPDRNLGRYLAKKLNREMTIWPGSCEVHVLFSSRRLQELKLKHPEALVIAHPECDDGILAQSDVVGSTSRLLEEVRSNQGRKSFIVATEYGILHQMQRARPDAELIQAPAEGSCACNECPYMKLNTLEKIRNSLKDLDPEVSVRTDVQQLARVSLDRMMALTDGKSIEWPKEFKDPNLPGFA
ncbi:MAG: quinolinate synthase NadA [Bdellovibrionales bacterium]|jgi:quinolinate synthase|nr:quinolinate synthase NadA [Bdellovibrionales bacterium]